MEADQSSLYDVIVRKFSYSNNGSVLSRVSIVAEIGEAFPDENEYKKHFQELFKMQDIDQTATGMALIYAHYLHLAVELPDSSVLALMEWLEMQDSRSLNLSSSKSGEYQGTDPISVVVADVVANSVRLGRQLRTASEPRMQSVLEYVQFSLPDLLTPQGTFIHLIRSEGLDRVSEYLSRNASMFDIHPDNELVWPLPVRLFPYD
eukprot:gene1522-4672_t